MQNKWNEMEFLVLQHKLLNSKLFGKEIKLDDDAFTLYTAYLIGIADCLTGEADEDDLKPLEYGEY